MAPGPMPAVLAPMSSPACIWRPVAFGVTPSVETAVALVPTPAYCPAPAGRITRIRTGAPESAWTRHAVITPSVGTFAVVPGSVSTVCASVHAVWHSTPDALPLKSVGPTVTVTAAWEGTATPSVTNATTSAGAGKRLIPGR